MLCPIWHCLKDAQHYRRPGLPSREGVPLIALANVLLRTSDNDSLPFGDRALFTAFVS